MDVVDRIICFVTCIILVVSVFRHFIPPAHNNACKKIEDYYSNLDHNPNCYYNPDHGLTVPEIITRYGYHVEVHAVSTEDHYVLSVFRIPHGKNANVIGNKPVYLQHGLFLNSGAFLLMGNKSLPFLLADAGYDVWLGNFRGTLYSTHVNLNEKDSEFWDFSLYEYAAYDLGAIIHLVRDVTQKKIIYIGYSYGSTAAMIYNTLNPELAKDYFKILVHIATYGHPLEWNSWNKNVMSVWKFLLPIWKSLSYGELNFKKYTLFDWYDLCLGYPIQKKFCQPVFSLAHDFNLDKGDPETLPTVIIKGMEAISIKAYSHLTQAVLSKTLRKYDYGSTEENKMKYGTTEPPVLQLSNLNIPSYFIRGENDVISTKKNVDFIYDSLPRGIRKYPIYVVKDKNFSHGDFLWNNDVVPLVYKPIITFLNEL
ncbi:hypothetical protein FQA39_LY14471 [Lamprigera yunnana]|nr:hypothetical protein FQA39_LY14471 [Lamprigera yunnana]